MRLPTRIVFPFGYVIRVRQISRTEMWNTVGENALAGWLSCERTIYLTRSRSTRQKRADLGHELGHAIVDYNDHLLTSGIGKI